MVTILIPVFILACLLLILIFVIFLLFFIPVRFAISFLQHEGKKENSISISWGMFCFRMRDTGDERRILFYIGGKVIHSRAGMVKWQKHEEVKSPAPEDLRSVAGYLTIIPRLIEPVGKFGAVLYHESTFESINGRIRIGTGDPVATGMLYGGYWATRFVLMRSRIFIDMIPVFDRIILEMDLVIRLRINHPLRVILAGIRLYKDPTIRQGMVLSKPQLKGVSEV